MAKKGILNWQVQLEPGDIFCTRGDSPRSAAIRFFTRSFGEAPTRVNHSGVVVSPGSLETAIIVEALITVQEHTLYSQYAPPCKDKVVIYRRIGLFPIEKERMAAKARSYVGRKYGWGKLVTHFMDWCCGGVYLFRRLNHADPICTWVDEETAHEVHLDFGVPLGSTQPDDIDDYCRAHPDQWACIYPLQRLQA
jgi:hypothetical protein